jgi:toxin secretion/phage lysis holin
VEKVWKFVVQTLGAAVAWFLSLPTVLLALLILMGLDILAGIICAGKRREISSDASFSGTARKVMELILVLGVYALAWGLGLPKELGSAAAGAFCVTELISIVENASAIGVPIPKVITDLLDKLSSGEKPIQHNG